MSEKKQNDSVFATLSKINVNDKTEQKNGFTYLSWAYAVGELLKAYPDATFGVKTAPDGKPYIETPTGCFVTGWCTVDGIIREQVHPVLDGANRPVPKPTCFQVNTSCQRAITKAIALHGLGLYIYAGEDLPGNEPVPQKEAVQPAHPTPDKGDAPSAPPAANESKQKGIVTKTTSKHGVSKSGREYNRYGVQIDGVWYNTFDDDIGAAVREGDEVEFTATQNKTGQSMDIKTWRWLHRVGQAETQEKDEIQF